MSPCFIKLIEEWRNHLDNNEIVGAVIMDLLKAFDFLPHDLAKLWSGKKILEIALFIP